MALLISGRLGESDPNLVPQDLGGSLSETYSLLHPGAEVPEELHALDLEFGEIEAVDAEEELASEYVPKSESYFMTNFCKTHRSGNWMLYPWYCDYLTYSATDGVLRGICTPDHQYVPGRPVLAYNHSQSPALLKWGATELWLVSHDTVPPYTWTWYTPGEGLYPHDLSQYYRFACRNPCARLRMVKSGWQSSTSSVFPSFDRLDYD